MRHLCQEIVTKYLWCDSHCAEGQGWRSMMVLSSSNSQCSEGDGHVKWSVLERMYRQLGRAKNGVVGCTWGEERGGSAKAPSREECSSGTGRRILQIDEELRIRDVPGPKKFGLLAVGVESHWKTCQVYVCVCAHARMYMSGDYIAFWKLAEAGMQDRQKDSGKEAGRLMRRLVQLSKQELGRSERRWEWWGLRGGSR